MIFKYFIFTKIYSIFLGVVKVFILINSILKKIVTSTPIFSCVNGTEIDLIKEIKQFSFKHFNFYKNLKHTFRNY